MADDKVEMTIKMEVTTPQALALQAMFEYWNSLSSMGSSRKIGFYVDGDGDFHPNIKIKYSQDIPKLTSEMKKISVVEDDGDGNIVFDFDPIGWKLYDMEGDK